MQPKKTRLEQLSRGGDILRHKLNLLQTNIGAIIAPAALAGAVSYVGSAWLLAGKAWPLYWKYNLARLVPDFAGLSFHPALAINGLVPADFLTRFGGVYHSTFWFTSFIAGAIAGAAAYFTGRSVQKKFIEQAEELKDVHLRGSSVESKEQLTERVEAMWAQEAEKSKQSGQVLPHKYFLAGVPLPPRLAQRNILVTGGMGSGKSVAIFDLADQVAASGKTMVIYDKVTEFARYYYREGHDIIFNPFDSRFPGWNLFNEISQIYEFDQMAEYLIPTTDNAGGTGDYFKSTARTVFSSIMQRLWEEGKRTNEDLCRAVFETGQEDLYEWLKGTPAESLLNPESKGTGGGGVLTTLTDSVKVLRYVPSGNFSLKKFIREGGDRRLLITSKEEVHPILQPLTAMAMNVLYTTVMAGREVPHDKYWFFIDEFASLGKLPVFSTAVTEARKYGAVAVVGAQDVAQFDAMFGKDKSGTIISNLQNQLLLRVKEAETAERYSKMIGSGEFNEQSEGLSWGSNSAKDGASLNISRKEKRAVLASEIMLLPDCTGFMTVAGNFNTAKVSYAPKARAVNHGAEGWMPRADLELDATPPQQDEASSPLQPASADEIVNAFDGAPQEEAGPDETANTNSASSLETALSYLQVSQPEPVAQDTQAKAAEGAPENNRPKRKLL